MKLIEDKKYKAIAILISIPILLISQYYLYKFGIFRPMIKGAEIEIVSGDYIKDIDKYIIKLNETVTLSNGDYIKVPSYAKEPNIWFNILDDSKVLKLEGKNKIIAMKEEISSVAIMKNNRILKRADIKVVDPKIDVDTLIEGNLKYVGDKATITNTIKTNYERFKEKETVNIESTNKDIITVNGNKIEAVGVGNAKIIISSKSYQAEYPFNIQAKIDSIDIRDIEIQVNQITKLKPKIKTSPKNLKYPTIKYELVENKLPVERAIVLSKDGTVKGIRPGSEKVKITCGNKSKIITVNVVEKSTSNINIDNLTYSYYIIDGKLIINLEWDYIKDIYEYDLYLKNNSLNEKDFKLFKSIKVSEEDIKNSNRVSSTIEVDLIDGSIPDISLYVLGKTDVGYTNPSKQVNISEPKEDITNISVKNLRYEVLENSIKLVWDKVDMQDISYSVYRKDKLNHEDGFTLIENNIVENEFDIIFNEQNIDMEFYIIAHQNGKSSAQSNIISVKLDI